MQLRVILAICAALAPGALLAQPEHCARSLSEMGLLLGRLHFAREWRETTMQDGNPLLLRIEDRNGPLRMEFVKDGQGRWAEGEVEVCRQSGEVIAQVAPHKLTIGEHVGWLLRHLLQRGARFTLVALEGRRMRVSTTGWSGDFEPAAEP